MDRTPHRHDVDFWGKCVPPGLVRPRRRRDLSDREVVEAILTIGFYMTMARLTEATETDLDPAEGRRVFEAARAAADG